MNLSFEQLRQANIARGAQWDRKAAHIDDLAFRAMELGGEAGEAVEAMLCMLKSVGKAQNVAKKLVRDLEGRAGGMKMDEARAALAEELGDVVICADRVAEVLGINLGAATLAKFNKTSRKHGLIELLSADPSAPTRDEGPTITVHDGNGTHPTKLNKSQFDDLRASGMLWEFHPDAPQRWPHQ